MTPVERLFEGDKHGAGPGLHRMSALLAHPELSVLSTIPTARVAGTNGKGSTCAFLSEILRASGRSVARFTSPHMNDPRERFWRDGEDISAEALAEIAAWTHEQVTLYEARFPGDRVGAFERQVLSFARWVAQDPPDAVVLEVGIGGRLDSTRAWPCGLAGLTSVDLEHTALLGPTRLDIALEKAQAAPSGGVLLLGALPAELQRRVIGACEVWGIHAEPVAESAVVREARLDGDQMTAWLSLPQHGLDLGPVRLGLLGLHQAENAATATALALRLCGVRGEEEARRFEPALRSGLAAACWPARLERVAEDPPTYLDAAHTPDAARRLAESLPGLLQGRALVLVAACSADKDAAAVLGPLVGLAEVVITTRSARGQDAEALRGLVVGLGAKEARAVEPVGAALAAAREVARGCGGVVVLAGSLFAAGEGRAAPLTPPS